MRVLGLKQSAAPSLSDPYCGHLYGIERLNELMAKSDYIFISTPLTEQMRGMISGELLSQCQPYTVIINMGGGPMRTQSSTKKY